MSGYRRQGRAPKAELKFRRLVLDKKLTDQRAAFRTQRRQQRIVRRGGGR